MISVLKKVNKAERGRVKAAPTLGEVSRIGEPPTQGREEERSRRRGQLMWGLETGGRLVLPEKATCLTVFYSKYKKYI